MLYIIIITVRQTILYFQNQILLGHYVRVPAPVKDARIVDDYSLFGLAGTTSISQMGYSPMAGTAHSTTESRLCLNKRGTLSHLLEAQSFSNLAGQLESTSPSERNSYHGHP